MTEETLDYLVFEIIQEKKYPKLKDGDFIIRSNNNKLTNFLRWLCGN